MSAIGTLVVDEPMRRARDSGPQRRKSAPIADRMAREVLRKADPVLARLIDARPDFRPRAWMDELPPLDTFGTLVFQVAGQQLPACDPDDPVAFRTAVRRASPVTGGAPRRGSQVLRDSGMSTRKGATLRALAERFLDGRLSDDSLARMTDAEVESALTEVPGIGPWTARGFLLVLVSYLFASEYDV